jgi:hypothetical protein
MALERVSRASLGQQININFGRFIKSGESNINK